jgi:hypothetical protein
LNERVSKGMERGRTKLGIVPQSGRPDKYSKTRGKERSGCEGGSARDQVRERLTTRKVNSS